MVITMVKLTLDIAAGQLEEQLFQLMTKVHLAFIIILREGSVSPPAPLQ